jgi:hypothetical protein
VTASGALAIPGLLVNRGYLLGRIAPISQRNGKINPIRPRTQWPLRKHMTARVIIRTK